MDIRRIKQVVKYALLHSKQIMIEQGKGQFYRIRIFYDMVVCFRKYRMWTNQYVKEQFFLKKNKDKETIGIQYRIKGIERDRWQNEFVANRKFLNKYSDKKYELPLLREKRNKAYQKKYNMGKNCFVEYNVELSRQHYLPGTIKIGDKVLLAKNTSIDYSGGIEIGNNVGILDGVKILTHGHDYFGLRDDVLPYDNNLFPSKLIIGDNVTIGTRAMIMNSVFEIGENSIISAGSVVISKVPSNVLVGGNPAKIIAKLPKNLKVIKSNL